MTWERVEPNAVTRCPRDVFDHGGKTGDGETVQSVVLDAHAEVAACEYRLVRLKNDELETACSTTRDAWRTVFPLVWLTGLTHGLKQHRATRCS